MSSAHRGECVTTGGLYRPTHLCVVHLNCTKNKKKKFTVFLLWCGKVGGGGVWRGRGGGSMFQEVGGLHGVSEGSGVI